MIYWFFRFIFTTKKSYYALIFSVLFCFGIEFLQLLQHPILIEWRNNPMLRLVLGQGFLWTDLIAYCLGSLIAFFIDRKIINRYFK
ncbi:ribosomal maturation YjgA family protein [Sphingobacterium bovistauri]